MGGVGELAGGRGTGGRPLIFYEVRLADRFHVPARTYVHILNSKFKGLPLLWWDNFKLYTDE